MVSFYQMLLQEEEPTLEREKAMFNVQNSGIRVRLARLISDMMPRKGAVPRLWVDNRCISNAVTN